MSPYRTTTSTIKPDRLGLKLAGLFAVSFAFALLAFIAYSLLASVGEGAAGAPPPDPATTIVIDPRIEADLAKVLAFDTLPAPDVVKDPFTDRGGLSRTASAAVASAATGNTQPGASGGTIAVSKPPASPSQGTIIPPGGGATVPGAPVPGASSATRLRYEQWLSRISITGDAKIDPALFAIEDLLPVGIVDGGSGQQEVMFYSEAIGKTVSFPLGTMFYDGWLIELRPDGVVFGSNDQRRTLRMRSWARSIRALGQG